MFSAKTEYFKSPIFVLLSLFPHSSLIIWLITQSVDGKVWRKYEKYVRCEVCGSRCRRCCDVWLWFMWPQLNTAEICAALSICRREQAVRSWAKNWAKWIIKRFINICLASSSTTSNSTRVESRRKLKLLAKAEAWQDAGWANRVLSGEPRQPPTHYLCQSASQLLLLLLLPRNIYRCLLSKQLATLRPT